MKEEKRVKRRKGEKGSVTLFVLVSMMFFLMVIIFSYARQAEKINIQKRQIAQIQKEYEPPNIEETYYEVENKQPVTISLYKPNGQLYDIKEWTNQDLTLKIFYPGGIADAYQYYFIDGKQQKYEEGQKITKNCAIKVEYSNHKKEVVVTKIDKIEPNVMISPNGGNVYVMPTQGTATIKATITATDEASGIDLSQYAWSESNTVEPSNWTDFTSGQTISKADITTAGTWYLWTKVTDVAGNRATTAKVSNAFTVNDNTINANQITLSQNPNSSTWTKGDVTVTASYGANLTQNRKITVTGTANTDYTINGSTSALVKTNGKTVTAEATDIAGNKVTKQLTVNNIDKTAPTVSSYAGAMMYTDPSFASGVNNVQVYNNSANGTVTHTRKAMSDNPAGSGYGIEIKTSGKASPGQGGFFFGTPTAAGKEYITRIVAKIPVGYSIEWGSNAYGGTGATREWLTATAGTGKWEEYAFRVKCGSDGSFNTTNFYYLTGGSTATDASPVVWQLGYATVIDTDLWDTRNYIITVATDDQSGVIGYGQNQSSSTEPSYEANTANKNVAKISGAITANGTYYSWVKDQAGNVASKSVNVNKIDRVAPTVTSYAGAMMYTDPSFANGVNNVQVYNNSANGTVTHTRKAMSDNPAGSGYGIEIKTSGTASPGQGGFTFRTSTSAGKEYITRIVAKIPVGYSIEWASNAYGGTGATREWLTATAGTGKWEEYAFRVKCGSDGSFGTTNFYYLTGGSTATASSPIVWQLGYATVIDTDLWDTRNYIITVATDDQSGVIGYGQNQSSSTEPSYEVNTANKNVARVSGAITANGTYYSWVKDQAGNVVSKSVNVNRVDRAAPTVSLNPNGGAVYTMPTSGNATIKTILTASDTGGSGLNTLQYAWSQSNSTEPSNWVNFTSGNTVSKSDITTAGTWYLWTKVTDKAGNRATSIKVSNGFVVGANTLAANQITLTQNPAASTWTNGNVTVTAGYGANLTQNKKLTCTGTNSTDYTISGTTTVTVKTNGKTVTAEATDIAGNKVTKQLTVNNIDKTPPTVSISTSDLTSNSVKLTVTAEDKQSGLATSGTYKYYLGSELKQTSTTNSYNFTGLTAGTTYTLKVVVTDKAKNTTEKTVTVTPVVTLKAGDYVKYIDKNGTTRKCVVLWDSSSEYGVQIITTNTVEQVELGNGVINSTSSTEERFNISKDSYNNAITTLNEKAKEYLNTTYAESARCVGSVPNNPNKEGGIYIASRSWILEHKYNNNIKAADNNYEIDYNQMKKLNIQEAPSSLGSGYTTEYWLASRSIYEGEENSLQVVFHVRTYASQFYERELFRLKKNNYIESRSDSNGLRPVFTLKDTIKVTGGKGTSASPYTLGT